jgi:uncharacterized protein (DUF342 family)
MTQEEKISHLESKVDRLERVIDFIKERMGLSDKEQSEAVFNDIISCEKSKAQNAKALDELIKRGGLIS